MVSESKNENTFPVSGFDEWAETYDKSVLNDQFPLTGYTKVLERIFLLAEPKPGMHVLDLGTGTGNLAIPFQRAGCHLWCTDFSMSMLRRARLKLPEAHLLKHNLLTPLPLNPNQRFECIVSAYVFHHFNLAQKMSILLGLRPYLADEGKIIIGDVVFPDTASRDRAREAAGSEWEDEYYWLADETLAALAEAGMAGSYEQVSSCGGVFLIVP